MEDSTAPKKTAVGRPVEAISSEALKGLTVGTVREDATRYHHVRRSIIGAAHASIKDVSWEDMRCPRTWKEWKNYLTIFDSPDGWQRRMWDLLIVGLVLILTILLPFELLVPFYHKEKNLKNLIAYFMPTIFWLDVPVNFLGAYYHGTHLVTDQVEIFWHYFYGNPFTENRGWFLVDLLGNIPWDAFIAVDGEQKSAKLAKLAKLPKLLRIGKLMKYMGQYVTFAMFIQHCLISLLFLHIMASWYLGEYYGNDMTCAEIYGDDYHRRSLGGTSYGEEEDHGHCKKLGVAYLESMSSVISIIMGGTPTVDSEPVYSSGAHSEWLHLVSQVVGVALFWTIQADLIVVMLNSTNSYTMHRVSLDRAKQECAYFDLPDHLTQKVEGAMDYQWKAMVPSNCTLIRDESLSPHLREEIVLHFHGAALGNTALFAGCSSGCVAAAAMKLKTIVVQSFDKVITQGELGRELFLLSKGRCAVTATTDTIVAIIEEGSFFGETALVNKTNPFRTVNVLALETCELQQLDNDDFRVLCAEYPDVLSNAEMMMAMLEQDFLHCNTLWKYYMAEKNRMFAEAITETTEARASEVSLQAPDSPGARGLRRFSSIAKAGFDDTASGEDMSTAAVYKRKKEVLEASVLDGSLRIAALEDRKMRIAAVAVNMQDSDTGTSPDGAEAKKPSQSHWGASASAGASRTHEAKEEQTRDVTNLELELELSQEAVHDSEL